MAGSRALSGAVADPQARTPAPRGAHRRLVADGPPASWLDASDDTLHLPVADLRPIEPATRERFALLRAPLLPAAVRESRHRLLIAVLAVHVPALLLVGAGRGALHESGLLALPLLAAVLVARFVPGQRVRSVAVVLGLAWSSYAALHLTLGTSGAHLQPLLVIAVLALYQDPLLLGLGLVAEVLALAVPAQLQPSLVYMGSELRTPWTSTAVQAAALLGVAVAAALAWRRDIPVPVFAAPTPATPVGPDPDAAEHLQRARSAELALARRQTSYALMTSLARRNQSLIGRQLATLDDLERDERDPDVLAGLFALDHLATRMRRNAENLLVLAGAPAASRGFSQPVPVEELLRGAAAEVEHYARVDVSVGVGGAVVGQVVSDLAHLLAELLDNALACSPPDSQVTVGAAPGADGMLRMWVADEGIGMTASRLTEHNTALQTSTDELEVGATLGFPVVKRLAARHGLVVTLAAREGDRSGLVAYVDVPAALVVLAANPGDEVSTGPVRPAALPGRRAPRQAAKAGPGRRNELAVDARRDSAREGDAGADSWFAPTPLPAASADDPVEVWGEDRPETGEAPTPDEPPESASVAPPVGDPLPQRGSHEPGPVPVLGFLTDLPAEPRQQLPERPTIAAHPLESLRGSTPTLSAAVRAWEPGDGATAAAVPQTIVPVARAARTPLVRRVPQQALLEAGGAITPTVFEPGPETVPEADAAAATPDPVRAQDLLATYRAGLARARGDAAAHDPDVQADDPAVPTGAEA